MSQLEAPFSILRSIDFCKVGDRDFLSWVAASLPSLDATTTPRFLQEMPVYAHWLAIEMLRVHESAKTQLSDNTPKLKFKIAHGHESCERNFQSNPESM